MKKPSYDDRYKASRKSRLLTLLLCVFGGHLGLHYFYVERNWRGGLNLFLLLALIISTSVFGLYYFRIDFGTAPDSIFVHWREAVAVLSASILGITWILDIVHILQRRFRDSKHLLLK